MAYPLLCAGGFPVPLKAGKFEIIGYSVAPSTIGTQMDIGLVDDETIKEGVGFGNVIDSEENCLRANRIIHFAKQPANAGVYDFIFPAPVKTRNGLSLYTTNVLAGTFCVYVS